MAEKYYTLHAVVLRNRDYKEHDKLVHLFSLEQGRLTVLAKGAGRPNGGLRRLAQPLTQVCLTLARGRGSLDTLTQGEVERPFISLRQDLSKIAHASYMVELIDLAMPEGKPGQEVFVLLLSAFSLLDMDAEPFMTARFFELRLLAALGLAPQLENCLSCGRGILGGSFQLSPSRGGLLCLSCCNRSQKPEDRGQRSEVSGQGTEDRGQGAEQEGNIGYALKAQAPALAAGTVLTMRHLLESPVNRLPQLKIGAAAREEMETALAHYLNYHLEQVSKARALLKSLLE